MTSDPVERYLTRSRRLQRRSVLRPMAGGELVDETISLYRRSAAPLLIPLAIPALVMSAAGSFVTEYVLGRFFETENAGSIKGQMVEFISNAALGLFVAAPIWIIALTYGTALTVRHAGYMLLGQASTPSEAIRDAAKVLPSLVWVSFGILLRATAGYLLAGAFMLAGAWLATVTKESSALAGLVALVGILGLFVGFVWFFFVASRFGLVAPVAVLEGLRGRKLTQRVVELVKPIGRQSGAGGSIISLVITAAVLDLILSGSIGMAVDSLEIPGHIHRNAGGMAGEAVVGALQLLPNVLSTILVLPFFTIAITVLYFERRVRLEGYDITALANDIDSDRRARVGS